VLDCLAVASCLKKPNKSFINEKQPRQLPDRAASLKIPSCPLRGPWEILTPQNLNSPYGSFQPQNVTSSYGLGHAAAIAIRSTALWNMRIKGKKESGYKPTTRQ